MLPEPSLPNARGSASAASRPYQVGTLPHPAALAGDPIVWDRCQRIVLVRPDNVGDVLLLGPALRALRQVAPQARLTLLCSPAGAAVAPLLPEIDDVAIVSPVWQDAGPPPSPDPGAQLALVERIRSGGYDVAVIFTSFSQSPYPAAYVCLLAGVPVRAALSREFGGGVLTHWVPAPETLQHQADRAVHLLGRLGVPVAGVGGQLHAHLPDGAVTAARRVAALDSGERYVALLPGASCSSRRWEPARFAAVAGTLTAAGYSVVVVGSEREAPLVEAVTAGVRRDPRPVGGQGRVVPLAGRLDVPGLAGLLAGAEVALVNNSGGMHLADAVGTPVVALFAGTELVEEYAPRSVPVRVFNRLTTCTPCRAFCCPYGHECLDVTPAAVAAAVLETASARAA